MNKVEKITGMIAEIIKNPFDFYEGNLIHYARFIFYKSQSLENPYHNFRHLFHLLFLCYQACQFYKGTLTLRECRNMLIAALFHDFDHSGMFGQDDLNIERAIRGLRSAVLPEDKAFIDDIALLISYTEFPYTKEPEASNLCAQIMRDADMMQAMSSAWIQQVVFGLAREWGKTPIDVLRGQIGFLQNLKMHTTWGKKLCSAETINQKIQEVVELLEIFDEN